MSEPLLLPCPFCGAGETKIHINKGTWNGMSYGTPVSVEVQHWCEAVPGQPSRVLTRIGRDEASAVAAWNLRAPAVPEGYLLVPIAATTPLVCAIEAEIDNQITASAMCCLMHRQDGQYVWDAAVESLMKAQAGLAGDGAAQ